MGNGMLCFHHYFDILHNEDCRVFSSTHRPHFTPKEIPWYLYLLQAERTPGILNAQIWMSHLKISKDTPRIKPRTFHHMA